MQIEPAQIEEIFADAAAIRDTEGRAAYLDQACSGDAALRERVDALLAAHDSAHSFLQLPDESDTATVACARVSEGPGARIGRYKLLEEIGEGGFGVVFMAEQEEPVRRRVALKIIKAGMDTRQVVARFEAERQALAMMDHPHIARVFDAGATDAGRPYFVMELVKGIPITTYCDQQKLDIKERLKLFIDVCSAVQHAHQKGIIHRDLKPSNVMVTLNDDKPVPKIIDFGIAKATQAPLTDKTLFTEYRQLIGTPAYMSPEQAQMIGLDVDTRSDIYSLGVLLYELLTGTTPFDSKELVRSGYDEMRRIIREVEPPRPSMRLSTLASSGTIGTLGNVRSSDPKYLSQELRGELDWIVMKCLEKDRTRRYESAGSLAREIERYLHDEPVQACPPSIPYRIKKYARRHKVAAAFVGLLLAGLAGLTVSNIALKYERDAKATALTQATTESTRAQAISDLLQEMLGSANAERAKGGQYTLRELLDDFSRGLGDQLADQPEVDADIHATIGRAYHSLRLFPQAAPHVRQALDLRCQIYGPLHEKVAESLIDYAWNLQSSDEAVSRLHEALDIYRQLGTTGRPVILAMWQLQMTLSNQKKYDESAVVARQALELIARSPDSHDPERAKLLRGLGRIYMGQEKYVEAEQVLREAVALHTSLYGPRHLDTAFDLQRLGNALRFQEKYAEAEPILRDALSVFRQHFSADDTQVRSCISELKRVLEARGDQAAIAALENQQREHEFRSVDPEYQVRLAGLLLANPLPTDAHKAEARRLLELAVEGHSQYAAENPHNFGRRLKTARGYVDIANACVAIPDFADIVNDTYHRHMAELQGLLEDFPESIECQAEVAERYRQWGYATNTASNYMPQAELTFTEAVTIYEKLLRGDPSRGRDWFFLAGTCTHLARVQWLLGKREDASASIARAMEVYDERAAEIAATSTSTNARDISAHCLQIAYFLANMQSEAQAAEYVAKAADYAESIADPNSLADALYYLALVQARLGDRTGYRMTCKTLVELPLGELAGITRSRPIWTPCLAPGALDDPSLAVKLAEDFAVDSSAEERIFGLQMLGAAHYRAGQFEQAAERLEESIAAFPSDTSEVTQSINYPRTFLAMTQWQLGQKEEARKLLAKTLPDIQEELESPSSDWNRRATLEILRAEAEALIK